jgi:phosphatidylglycerol---prolipoprotein diacylglyceryl transferase
LYPRLFQFGHIAIPTYGVFTAIAIVAALAMALYTARKLLLDPNKIWNLCLTGIFTTLLGSRLLLILLHLSDFAAHPFWMLGLVSIRSRGIFYGAVALAICACIGYIFAARLPLRRALDSLAPAAAIGISIGSLGAFAAGSDYGAPTTLPWGVVYRHALATLWSGTPLGVRLHPVQAYEAVLAFLLFDLLLLCLLRRSQEGELAGIFLFAYGAILYFLDFYRGERSFLPGNAISVTQILGIACVLAGAALCVKRHSPTEIPG